MSDTSKSEDCLELLDAIEIGIELSEYPQPDEPQPEVNSEAKA